MDRIRITGGVPLDGVIAIGGAKNAALPLMAASLLTAETLSLENVPDLADIATMANLLVHHGAGIAMAGDGGPSEVLSVGAAGGGHVAAKAGAFATSIQQNASSAVDATHQRRSL